jgi:hypothetical protein
VTTSRKEAALKADTLAQFNTHNDRVTAVLAAADAHDEAHGIGRFSIDDSTVERGAEALAQSIGKVPGIWAMHSEVTKNAYRDHTRAVLTAALQDTKEPRNGSN